MGRGDSSPRKSIKIPDRAALYSASRTVRWITQSDNFMDWSAAAVTDDMSEAPALATMLVTFNDRDWAMTAWMMCRSNLATRMSRLEPRDMPLTLLYASAVDSSSAFVISV